jgi:hypothetical protein
MNWDSSVDIVTILRAVRTRKHGVICGWNKRCFCSECHIRWVPGTIFVGGKRPGPQATACYEISFRLYHSLNAIMARYKDCLLELTIRFS